MESVSDEMFQDSEVSFCLVEAHLQTLTEGLLR